VLGVGTLWIAGVQARWSPDFAAGPLPDSVVAATSGAAARGAKLFADKACVDCHRIAGHGGRRGPDLSDVADRLTRDQITIRISNGGTNMPAFAGILTRRELDDLVAFLETRRRPADAGRGP